MAKTKNKNSLASLIDQVIQQAKSSTVNEHKVVDIITFCEHQNFLNFKGQDPPLDLWPMQKIVLKLFYRGRVATSMLS